MKKQNLVDCQTLATAVKANRKKLSLSQRSCADEVGVTASTVSRVETGNITPDAETIAKFTNWLGWSVEEIFGKTETPFVTFYHTKSVPTIVAEHLTQDPNLSPEAARLLTELFAVAYEKMTENQNQKKSL